MSEMVSEVRPKEGGRYACPRCGQATVSESRLCASCRWQQAKLSSANSKKASQAVPEDAAPLLPETLVLRLGERLVQQGLLDQRSLQQALQEQARRSLAGKSVMLGQLLVEMGLITAQMLDRAAVQQSLELQQALRQSNLQLESRVRERTAQLRMALAKLNDLNQLKADFVASVSHELRTPLTILTGYVEMLANESLGTLNDDQAQALRAASTASKRLRTLIEDLLQFSESSMGAISLNLASISLVEPVRQAIDQTREKAGAKRVRLEADLPVKLPAVNADAQKIAWVIGELLENAVKFTPLGGLVKVQVVAGATQLSVAVVDTGIGIPAERIEETFEPFHQLDGSMERKYGGTGIGLALARRIIEAHGSTIEVRSNLGKGSCFTFTLPASA
jgi:signal transduction histidine kinase